MQFSSGGREFNIAYQAPIVQGQSNGDEVLIHTYVGMCTLPNGLRRGGILMGTTSPGENTFPASLVDKNTRVNTFPIIQGVWAAQLFSKFLSADERLLNLSYLAAVKPEKEGQLEQIDMLAELYGDRNKFHRLRDDLLGSPVHEYVFPQIIRAVEEDEVLAEHFDPLDLIAYDLKFPGTHDLVLLLLERRQEVINRRAELDRIAKEKPASVEVGLLDSWRERFRGWGRGDTARGGH